LSLSRIAYERVSAEQLLCCNIDELGTPNLYQFSVAAKSQVQKPYYNLTLAILAPSRLCGHILSSRLFCTPKALWKLNWFLRDFGYDTELLGRDEVDERQLIGLKGVVKISHIVFNGFSLIRLDGFASCGRWEELSPANLDNPQVA
jgi:hypothetical protein